VTGVQTCALPISKLIEKSKKEKWNYKGLTIVDGYDKLKVYFY
jgi:hypothetical protein